MQGLARTINSCLKQQYSERRYITERRRVFLHSKWVTCVPIMHHHLSDKAARIDPPPMPQKGLENTTVAQVLMTKGEEKVGPWLWCHTNDTVYDAVKQMAHNNIGSLVVLKPGNHQLIAGIITERDYLQKVIVKDRSSKYTKVAEIMTEQDKLITVSSDTNIFHAMRLMTENQIRHVPVIDGRIVGMISIVDVVRAVVEQQSGEVKQLNEFIKGDYY